MPFHLCSWWEADDQCYTRMHFIECIAIASEGSHNIAGPTETSSYEDLSPDLSPVWKQPKELVSLG